MQTFYLNTTTSTWYDSDGNEFRRGNPSVAFGALEDIQIITVTSSEGANTNMVSPESWPRDESWQDCKAIIGVDNDYIHRLRGETIEELGGEVSIIGAKISSGKQSNIPFTGNIKIYSAAGDAEVLAYTDREFRDGVFYFDVDATLVNEYPGGATVDVPQSPYCSAIMDPQSTPNAGTFLFQLRVDSARLREEMLYTSRASLPVQGMEILFYRESDSGSIPVRAFLLDTFSIRGTINNVNVNESIDALPEEEIHARLLPIVEEFIASGLEVQLSVDGSEWVNADNAVSSVKYPYFRMRNIKAGGEWSAAIRLPDGPKGADGTMTFENLTPEQKESLKGAKGDNGTTFTPSVDSKGNLSWTNEDGLENPATVNIKGPKGADGTMSFEDLTPEQKESLKGKPGYTPVRGTDYWTESDIASIESYIDEKILNGEW